MARIDAAFHGLQPIALLQTLGDEGLLRRHHGEFPFRQRRLLVGGTHIGPQHRAALHQRIGCELDLFAEAALDRLGGNLDALAGHVVFPAVIGAAQPALLVASEPQRHAAMGAEFIDQAVAALGIAEGKQALGEKLDPYRRAIVVRQFLGEQRRQPIAAEQLSHLRAGAGLGQKLVLFFSEHCACPWPIVRFSSRVGIWPRPGKPHRRRARGRNPHSVAHAPGHDRPMKSFAPARRPVALHKQLR